MAKKYKWLASHTPLFHDGQWFSIVFSKTIDPYNPDLKLEIGITHKVHMKQSKLALHVCWNWIKETSQEITNHSRKHRDGAMLALPYQH